MAAVKMGSSLLVTTIVILAFIPIVVSQSQCGNLFLQAISGAQYITSPNYPGDYSNNTDCTWRIAASTASVVALKALNFSVEGPSPSCYNDYVTIYDGDKTYSPTITKWCGQVSSLPIISTGSAMMLVFHSNAQVSMSGFRFEYRAQTKSALCDNKFTVGPNGTSWYLTSPGYPYKYTSNLDCSWILTANSPLEVAVINLVDFNLEGDSPSCTNDYLSIYDGNSTSSPLIEKLCGRVSSTQRASSGMNMTVVFHSDQSDNYSGFKLYFTSEENSVRCSNGTLSATGSSKHLVSPNFPSNYTINTNCQWTITAASPSEVVVLTVLTYYLEDSALCQFDYVTIYDGSNTSSSILNKTCGQLLSQPFISTGPTLTVYFHSDELVTSAGFSFEYTSHTKSDLCSNFTFWQYNTDQYLTSPGYPYSYTSGLNCAWRITADSPSQVVLLTLISFYIPGYQPNCATDYVAIYDGYNTSSPRIQTLCGSLSRNDQFQSTGNYVYLVLRSSERQVNEGFFLSYTFPFKPAQCADVTLSAGFLDSYLSSPNYPDHYPSNMDCKWFITASSDSKVKLSISEFYLDGSQPSCTNDYVKIYDGASTSSSLLKVLCGSDSYEIITSTGSVMTVVFKSDSGTSYNNRFRFTYSSESTYQPSDVDTDDSDYSSPSTGSVTGIVFGCIIFTSFSTTLGVYYRRRTILRQRTVTRTTVVTQNVSSQNNTRSDNGVFVLAVISNNTNVTQAAPTETQTSQNRPEPHDNGQSSNDPPRYSTLMNSDMNDSSLNYTPSGPGYGANVAPPPYSAVPGGSQASGGGAYFNTGFDASEASISSYKQATPSAPVRDSIYNN